MDKSDMKVHERESDTSSVITMKEYAPSEYPSSEPPPAYMKPRSNALRIAKLAAFTVIVSSIILGGFILAASWIQANTARNLDLTLNQELLDDLQPSYEHLVANEVVPDQKNNEIDQEQARSDVKDENQISLKDEKNNDEGLLPPPPPPKTEGKKVLDLDEIANILMQKNVKGNVNCVVEKRRNEELVDHAPMSLNLPLGNLASGVNITTPPRLQHLTGEQMIIICKGDEDEEKDSNSDEEGDEDVGKADQLQSLVFPLPSQLLNQIQQIPQIIPLNRILQHIQMQQVPVQQIQLQQVPLQQVPQVPIQQVPLQQIQMQQIPIQQVPMQQVPLQSIQLPQIPVQQLQVQQLPVQQMPAHQIPVNQFPQQQQQQQPQVVYQQPFVVEQQQPKQHIMLPQKMLFPQPQMVNPQPNVQFAPEMTPLKEVNINQERIPMNHVFHNRVPINSLAINDIPLSRMPITHLPMRAEPQMREEPVPVHHLMPPQPQQYQAENFKQEEPKFNGPFVQEPINRLPFLTPQFNQQSQFPVEVRDPGVLRMPVPVAQEPRERFPGPMPANQLFIENREPEFIDESPNREFHPIDVDVRSRGQRKEPMVNARMPEMAKFNSMPPPLNFERRPQGPGRRIRFPEMIESDEVRENHMPIITEITKIIPIRLEKEEPEANETPIIPVNADSQNKNMKTPEIKLEKLPPRPFPIPINAILDMIFRGIRPLMGNRGLPIPIDIKIERIENKPLEMVPPFIKKFEFVKKESPNSLGAENDQSISSEKNGNENVPDKDVVETKVERVEIFNREAENAHPIPIPADAQEPQVFKIEDQEKSSETNDRPSFEDQAFLPNGQGRGARVFPIPQSIKEAEIFSVFDAKSDKNVEMEVPMESSLTVVDSERPNMSENSENRQGKIMDFPGPIINFFPLPEEKVMKPQIQIPKVQPKTFTVTDQRSVKLYPVPNASFKSEELKAVENPNVEENRPHFVQPRSV